MTSPTLSNSHNTPYDVGAVLHMTVTVVEAQLEAALRRHLSFVVDKAIKLHTDDEELVTKTVQFNLDGRIMNAVLTDVTYDALGHVHRVSLFVQDPDLRIKSQTSSAGYVIVVEAFGVNDVLRPRQILQVVTFNGPTPVFVDL